jgi:hypothetical protein
MDEAARAVRGFFGAVAGLAKPSGWEWVRVSFLNSPSAMIAAEILGVVLALALVSYVWRRLAARRPHGHIGPAEEDEAGRITIGKRFRLLLNVAVVVAVLIFVKVEVHAFHFEFLVLDTLFSSIVASAIFIIGFLLTSILPDYKEAERIPSDIRTALEAIYDDVANFAERATEIDLAALREMLSGVVFALEAGLGTVGGHTHVEAAIAQVDRLVPYIGALEHKGMSPNFVVRLRNELDVLRRCLFRVHYIQKIEFVPSVEVLIQTLVCAVLFMLLCLKTDGSYGTAFLFGFVSYLFVYSMHLIAVFQKPYRQGSHSVDKVDLFLLRDFVRKMRR